MESTPFPLAARPSPRPRGTGHSGQAAVHLPGLARPARVRRQPTVSGPSGYPLQPPPFLPPCPKDGTWEPRLPEARTRRTAPEEHFRRTQALPVAGGQSACGRGVLRARVRVAAGRCLSGLPGAGGKPRALRSPARSLGASVRPGLTLCFHAVDSPRWRGP